MVHLTSELHVFYKPGSPDKYRPKNMTLGKPYQVVAEKTLKFSKDNKDYEDIQFGIIGDNFELTFVASYNCHVIIHDGSSNAFTDYHKFLSKIGIKNGEKADEPAF